MDIRWTYDGHAMDIRWTYDGHDGCACAKRQAPSAKRQAPSAKRQAPSARLQAGNNITVLLTTESYQILTGAGLRDCGTAAGPFERSSGHNDPMTFVTFMTFMTFMTFSSSHCFLCASPVPSLISPQPPPLVRCVGFGISGDSIYEPFGPRSVWLRAFRVLKPYLLLAVSDSFAFPTEQTGSTSSEPSSESADMTPMSRLVVSVSSDKTLGFPFPRNVLSFGCFYLCCLFLCSFLPQTR